MVIPNQKHDGKFLVNFFHSFTDKQIFFAVWAVIVGVFVTMIISYYRRQTRSNFRRPGEGSGPHIRVDQRRLDPARNQLPTKNEICSGENREGLKRRT